MSGVRKQAELLAPRLNPRNGVWNVVDYGAVADNATDNRAAIQATIDACWAAGGGIVTTPPVKNVYRFSGRLQVRAGVTLDFGDPRGPSGSGLRLTATSTDGGVDLLPGGHIRAYLSCLTSTTFVGPMLDINEEKIESQGYGRNDRYTSFDVHIYGGSGLAANQVGVRLRSNSNTNGGVSWMTGRAVVNEMRVGVHFDSVSTGYINENWFDFITFGCVTGVLGTVAGTGEISANRIRFTSQSISTPVAQRALTWDGRNNEIDITVWDWTSGRIDGALGGFPVLLTEQSGNNKLRGFITRGSGLAGTSFGRMSIVDLAPKSNQKNFIYVTDRWQTEGVNLIKQAPASSFENSFCGDQDDALAYATRRYTVTAAGTTPPDSTNLNRLFELSEANCVVNDCVDFSVKIDLGATPTKPLGIGVIFNGIAANRPTTVVVEGSSNDSTWATLLEAGLVGDAVPNHLFRTEQFTGRRYIRITVTGTGAGHSVHINRLWMVDYGVTRFQGAFPHVYNPAIFGGLFVSGTKVVGTQGASIADVPTGGSATAAANATAINSILARLRAHGLIAT